MFLLILFTEIEAFFFRHNRNQGNEYLVEFFVRLCSDTLICVLQTADRRQLTELERVGRRFHLIGENFFGKKPFFRLNLKFEFGYLFCTLKYQNIKKV